MSKWRWINISIFFAAAALGGCSRSDDASGPPRKVLESYIAQSFAVKSGSDRAALLAFLTSDAKIRLAAWSEEQFLEAFVNSKRQFLKLAIKEEKEISARESTVVYEIAYVDQSRGKDAKVTSKKLCLFTRDAKGGPWLVAEVRNLQELIEFSREMSLP